MKKVLFILFALLVIVSCGSSREDDPTPTPAPKTISANFHGTWKVMKKENDSGTMIDNTDASLLVTVTATTVKYKLDNGGSFEGTGTIENGSNADAIQLSNGTKLTMFKTLHQDWTQNFVFYHANGKEDDVMVKKQ